MFSWVWNALLGMYYRRTTLFGLRTTIFVRRMLLIYLPAGAATMLTMPEMAGLTWPMRIAMIPVVAFAIMYALGFGFFLIIRICGLWLPVPFSALVSLADLFWRLEAGSEPADEQDRESEADIAAAERLQHESEWNSALKTGSVAVGLGRVEVHGEWYDQLEVEGGKLYGMAKGERKEIGAVRTSPMAGGGIELVDLDGGTVARTDEHGRGDDGEYVLHPEGMEPEAWDAAMNAPPPPRAEARRLRFGPLIQSAAMLLFVGASYGLGELISDGSDPGSAPLEADGAPHDGFDDALTAGAGPAAAEPATARAQENHGHEGSPGETRVDTSVEDEEAAGPSERQLFPLDPSGFAASSELRGYPARKAFDGDPATTWTEGVDGHGAGEWVEARFDRPQRVRRITVSTGFDKIHDRTGDLFPLNAHVRRLRVQLGDGTERIVDVGHDQRRATIEGLDATTRTVRIVADEVWEGERWADLCISEVWIEGE